MTGNESKLEDNRPSTEPLFSRGPRAEFPTFQFYGKTNYVDFIRFHTYNNQQTLISQSVQGNYMQATFGNHKTNNTRNKQFWVSSSFKEVKEQVKSHTKAGMNIFSLAADHKRENFMCMWWRILAKHSLLCKLKTPKIYFCLACLLLVSPASIKILFCSNGRCEPIWE